MPHSHEETHGHPVHHYHRERTTIRETEDDYICDEDGCRPLPEQEHRPPGIVAKLKHFFLGPSASNEAQEDNVKIVHVHHYDKNPHGHRYAASEWADEAKDTVREIGDSARRKAYQVKNNLVGEAERLKEEGEEAAEVVQEKAGGVLNRLWSGIEQTKEKLENALHGAEKRVEDAEESAEERYNYLRSKAGKRYRVNKDKAADITVKKLEDVKEKLENVKDKIYEQYEHGRESFENQYDHVKDTATNEYEKARQRVHGNLGNVRNRIHDGVETVEETAEQIASRARNTVEKASDSVRQAAEAGRETLHNAADSVKNSVEETAQRIKESVNNAKENVRDKAERVKEGISDSFEGVKDDVKEGISSVKEGFKGALHKAEQAAECLGCVGPRKRPGYESYGARSLDGRWSYPQLGPNPVPVTAFYSALSTLWFLWLARRVWMARNRAKVFVGDGSAELSRELSRDVVVSRTTVSEGRAEKTTAVLHTENSPALKKYLTVMRANDARTAFSTNVPLYLILLCALELAGAYRPLLHILSLAFLAGNIVQTEYGIFSPDAIGRGRPIGLATNWAVMLFGSAMAVYLALSCNGCPAV
ncbi:uncharacterized protein SPPG_08578 [Spizellomyces punctatus DAOM BR117]|uniref:Uncharacterized protein n=1 Tax=Spizellomyces punctatus (strain DAOM BR117) TaxID=645134 RepID=A0A0L0H4S7_SPIPD|nr:uncharacterized protein SPPG_08578 [Spizellomyces punctatus DAOM BR117]KNC95974.1 hypothetical protein SPPG_08578 [Spizellomyces punctatus DAOM BR117]|eukprot:XP_016604014.1 hypothetical protein SPPG_08578 [Spizellomyces punctatus DAOM BR117]